MRLAFGVLAVLLTGPAALAQSVPAPPVAAPTEPTIDVRAVAMALMTQSETDYRTPREPATLDPTTDEVQLWRAPETTAEGCATRAAFILAAMIARPAASGSTRATVECERDYRAHVHWTPTGGGVVLNKGLRRDGQVAYSPGPLFDAEVDRQRAWLATGQTTPAPREDLLTGTVRSSRGDALIGVRIRLEGSRRQAVTNLGGRFEVPVANATALVVGYTGFKDCLVPIRPEPRPPVAIRLKSGRGGTPKEKNCVVVWGPSDG